MSLQGLGVEVQLSIEVCYLCHNTDATQRLFVTFQAANMHVILVTMEAWVGFLDVKMPVGLGSGSVKTFTSKLALDRKMQPEPHSDF